MKNLHYLFLLSFALSILSCSGKKEEVKPTTSLSEQNFEFKIYDSLVVDYLGNLALMDISPDGNTFLLQDNNTQTMIVSDKSGKLLHQYKLSGEGPNEFKENPLGKAKYLNDEEFVIPTTGGIYRYSIDGKLQKEYELDFTSAPQLIVGSADNLIIGDGQLYTTIPGRGSDEYAPVGIEFQEKSQQLEVLDLATSKYSPAISFPKTSKFNSTEKAYPGLSSYANIGLLEDTLYLNFRNEPKIFAYPISDLENLAVTKSIPLPSFIEIEPKDDKAPTSFELKDIFVGTINRIIPIGNNQFLIDYLSGLTDEEFNEAMDIVNGDVNNLWGEAAKLNSGGLVLFNGSEISQSIHIPEILGNLNKYLSKEEVWFSLNFSKAENDYSVIYKTRLVAK